ncbi:MAG: M20/M25/M40 family metallo-hydrolase [Steroidobacteraceae bacterium]|nr:M20/M25/M40 family metallo-hydrolase [Steroidobacteraceae bacterium]
MKAPSIVFASCVLALLGPLAHSAAQPSAETIAATLRDKALHDPVAWDFVSELTTRIGPRPAGSAAERAAAEWSARKLEALGFENVHIESFPMTAWVRGAERAEIVAPSPQPLSAVSLGGAPATAPGGVEGEVVLFSTLDELMAAAPGSLAGKIAMVTFHMPRTQDGSGYGTAVLARSGGPAEAAKRGAVGFLLRSLATGGHRFPHAGATRYVDGRVPIPAFAVSEPDADQIERLTGLGEKVRVRLTSAATLVPNATSYNVIGEIRGTDRASEVIVLGAHLDSWDTGTGAIDDAAGCAIVTAAARLAKEAPRKPQRTLRVVLYGSEEVSQPSDTLLGGRTYLEKRKAEIGSHVLAGESDFGAGRVYSVSLPAGAANSAFGRTLQRLMAPIGVISSSQPPGNGGADVAPLAAAGVPVFLLNQDGTHYFDYHHTADDTLDKVNPEELAQNVAAWVTLAWLAADSDVDFRALAGAAPSTR